MGKRQLTKDDRRKVDDFQETVYVVVEYDQGEAYYLTYDAFEDIEAGEIVGVYERSHIGRVSAPSKILEAL